jgi:hypothetical protein
MSWGISSPTSFVETDSREGSQRIQAMGAAIQAATIRYRRCVENHA